MVRITWNTITRDYSQQVQVQRSNTKRKNRDIAL